MMKPSLSCVIFSFVTVFFIQCSSKYNDNIEIVLDGVGNKRGDLEAVLEHYVMPADSLKRKAAYFLVENFPEDQVQTIDKQLMIENIELAFEVWKKPWAKHLNFDEFKELVLPFNLERDSTGTFWRKRFMDEYAFVEDSLKKYPQEDPAAAACTIVNNVLKTKYSFEFDMENPDIKDLNDWERNRSGDCAGISSLTNHIMHAVGVPTSQIFTPQWANLNFRHYWNIVLVNHRFLPFMGGDASPRQYKVEFSTFYYYHKTQPKVYRITYAINRKTLPFISGKEPIPRNFRDKHIIDESKKYIPTTNFSISVPDSINQKFVYLCVPQSQSWAPVCWGEVSNNKVIFTDIRPGVIYATCIYVNGKMRLFNNPFLLTKVGSKRFFIPDPQIVEKVICDRKFPADDTNLIKIGDIYELFYWNRFAWHSLGKKVATNTYIPFENAPKNALLYLKNHTRGFEERVFFCKDGKQCFI